MTTRVVEKIRGHHDPRFAFGLEFVLHTLEAAEAARAFLPRPRAFGQQGPAVPGVDVERLFAAVDLLIDRHEQPWSPFVLSWHSGLDALATDQAVQSSQIANTLRGLSRDMDSRYEMRSNSHGRRATGGLSMGSRFGNAGSGERGRWCHQRATAA